MSRGPKLQHLGRLRTGLSFVIDYLQAERRTAEDFADASPVPTSWPIPGELALAQTSFGKSSRALVRPGNRHDAPWALTSETIIANYRAHMLSAKPSAALLAAFEERKGYEGGLIPRLYLSPHTLADETVGWSAGLVAAVAMASLLYYEVGGKLHSRPGTYAAEYRGLTLGVVAGRIVGTGDRWPEVSAEMLDGYLKGTRLFPLDGLNSAVVKLRNLLWASQGAGAPVFHVCNQALAFAGMAYRRDWAESSHTASPDWDLECDLLTARVQEAFAQRNHWVSQLHTAIHEVRERITLLRSALVALNEGGLPDAHLEGLARGMLVPSVLSEKQFREATTRGSGRHATGMLGNHNLIRNLEAHLAVEQSRLLKKEGELHAKRNW